MALWFGTLGGPIAWGFQVLIGSELPELACSPGSAGPAVGGVGVESILVALDVTCALVAVLAALVAWRCWRRTGGGDESVGGRARWMAVAGIFTSVLSLVVIIQGFFPLLLLSGCSRSL